MGKPEQENKITAQVVETSNSGNPVIKRPNWDKKVVVVTEDRGYTRGDSIAFIIQQEHGDHYAAVPPENAPVSPPEYDSSPNIPIHHDGKSVGTSRSEKKSMESVEEKEFNPKTHNAPELESDKRTRSHLRTSGN
jgi:hypothetical protein